MFILASAFQLNKACYGEGQDHLELGDRLVNEFNSGLRGLVDQYSIIAGTEMYYLEVAKFRRDSPNIPRDRLTFERFDGGSTQRQGMHLFWDNRAPNLSKRPGGPRYKFASYSVILRIAFSVVEVSLPGFVSSSLRHSLCCLQFGIVIQLLSAFV